MRVGEPLRTWSLTRSGLWSHLAPGLRNAPTSSFFLVSTLMTGTLSAAQRSRSSVMCWNCSSRFAREAPARFLWLTRSENPIFLRSRATVRAQMSVPSLHSSAATLAVVRRVHFRPRTGSPAVSWSIRASMWAMTSGFFFRPRPPAARAPHPVALDVALDKLPPAGGDRRRVDAEQSGDAPVAAPPALERFETGEQAPLPLVEQAGEQHDRGAQLLRHQVGLGQGPYETGRGHQQALRAQLVCLLRAVDTPRIPMACIVHHGRAPNSTLFGVVTCRSSSNDVATVGRGGRSTRACVAGGLMPGPR